jgi:excisionase family DNA binding protein
MKMRTEQPVNIETYSLPVPLLTVKEVAQILRVSERTVRRLIVEKKLRVVRIGRSVRVGPNAVAALTGVDM